VAQSWNHAGCRHGAGGQREIMPRVRNVFIWQSRMYRLSCDAHPVGELRSGRLADLARAWDRDAGAPVVRRRHHHASAEAARAGPRRSRAGSSSRSCRGSARRPGKG
jgi:hypothetical protein